MGTARLCDVSGLDFHVELVSLPNSVAQMPVPVPMSSTFRGFSDIGARCNLLSIVMTKRRCWRSV